MNRAGFGAESEASQATGGVHDENLLNQVMKDKRHSCEGSVSTFGYTQANDVHGVQAKPDVQTPVRCLQVLDASAQNDGY